MAKQNGLGDALFVDGYDLSGDIGALESMASPCRTLDVTAINKTAMERLYGIIDGEITFRQFFNDASNQEHAVLKAKGSGADRVVTYMHGSTLGGMAATLVAKQITYDWERGADGSLSGTTQCLSSNGLGLTYSQLLTAGKRTDTGATAGTSLDGTAASSLGLSASLQVISFVGTDATVKIEESSDNGGSDAFAAVVGGSFTQITTAPISERIVTSLTLAVERYLRVTTVTTGGFTSLVFVVSMSRTP